MVLHENPMFKVLQLTQVNITFDVQSRFLGAKTQVSKSLPFLNIEILGGRCLSFDVKSE